MTSRKEIAKLKKLLVDELPTDDVREVERHIVKIYEECYFVHELQQDAIFCMHMLLGSRWRLMHPVVFTNDDRDWNYENSEMEVLYRTDHPDCWNEHMDREKTAPLNIVYGVHNMIDHCHWTLQDLMGIRSYSTKIEIDYRRK